MADENKTTDKGGPDAQSKLESSRTHARKDFTMPPSFDTQIGMERTTTFGCDVQGWATVTVGGSGGP